MQQGVQTELTVSSLCLQQERLRSRHPNTEHLQESGGCSRNKNFTPHTRTNQLSRLELGGFTKRGEHWVVSRIAYVPWARTLSLEASQKIWKPPVEKPTGQILLWFMQALDCAANFQAELPVELNGVVAWNYSILVWSGLFCPKSQCRDVAQSVHLDKEQFNKALLWV